jgi:vacuolar-type H+-ATPase subunit F/Vma7
VSEIVALGESARVEGYALAGVTVLPTDDVGAQAAWRTLPDGTGLVLLTAAAAAALRDELSRAGRVLWAILPS